MSDGWSKDVIDGVAAASSVSEYNCWGLINPDVLVLAATDRTCSFSAEMQTTLTAG